MTRVRIHNFSISLDGFGTGEGQSAEAPFGHAGHRLHEWMIATRFGAPIVGRAGGSAGTDIGALEFVFRAQGFGYLAGGLIFGIALFRARVLTRWACVLLAVSGLVSAALAVMPDAFYRLLAFPNAIALIVLGYSLWTTTRTTPGVTTGTSAAAPERAMTAGAE